MFNNLLGTFAVRWLDEHLRFSCLALSTCSPFKITCFIFEYVVMKGIDSGLTAWTVAIEDKRV